ncbi:MAG: IS4 family transposase [Pseudomonadota bacterium]
MAPSTLLAIGAQLRQARQRLMSDALSDLIGLFGGCVPEEFRPDAKSPPGTRRRFLTPAVTFWAFLSQVLTPAQPCREIVRKLVVFSALFHRKKRSANTSAYCQARKKLPLESLPNTSQHIAATLDANVKPAALWQGRRVGVVDGSTLSMPDTAANQKAYPQPKGQKPGCGFPVMKIVGLFSLATGALHDIACGTLHIHERLLFHQLWDRLAQLYDLILGDRGFGAFVDQYLLKQRGVDSVFRQHQKRRCDFRKGRRLGKDDHLVVWRNPPQKPAWVPLDIWMTIPDEWIVREIRFHIPVKGFRTQTIVCVTTLLDPNAYPASAIAELYFWRWRVELFFRDIKITLGMDVLRCRTPDLIHRELWMHLVAYNLIRTLIYEAACLHRIQVFRISFKGSVDTVRQWAPVMATSQRAPREYARIIRLLLHCLARDLVPERPNRSEPRARKRRPKNYQLLTKPRHLMGNLPHRNKPSKTARKHA